MFFIQGAALGIWLVPLTRVLEAHGLGSIRPLAYATSAIAAFVSPLIFAAVADRHMAPVRVLRWLGVATAIALGLATTAIGRGWHPTVVLGFIQLYALCSSPSWSLASTIVFASIDDAKRQFGPLRAMATVGWMAGCWSVSALQADSSTVSGYTGMVAWLGISAFTLALPAVDPPAASTRLTLSQRMGWDALALLRIKDHRGIFVTAALLNIPLAAFYPFTPPHLRELGFEHTSAWMTLGQVSEIVAMLSLAALLRRFRLKWVFAAGLSFGVLRFALCALDGRGWVLAGGCLHGLSYTLVIISAQIYLAERIDPEWSARAQALLTLMTSGVGNLLGYLGTGQWFAMNSAGGAGGRVSWSRFWLGLSLTTAGILIFFLVTYRGRGARPGAVREGV